MEPSSNFYLLTWNHAYEILLSQVGMVPQICSPRICLGWGKKTLNVRPTWATQRRKQMKDSVKWKEPSSQQHTQRWHCFFLNCGSKSVHILHKPLACVCLSLSGRVWRASRFFSSTPLVASVSLFTSDSVFLWPGSRYVAQAGFKLTAILPSQPPEYRDYRHTLSQLASFLLFLVTCMCIHAYKQAINITENFSVSSKIVLSKWRLYISE